jgi:hypothetical protein
MAEMSFAFWGKASAIWFAIAVGAIINGLVRDLIVSPALGEAVGRPLSAASLLVVVFCLTWAWVLWADRPSDVPLWSVGSAWLVATVAFEFLLGRMRGLSLPEILEAYNPFSPTLWDVVLLGILLAPITVGRFLHQQL